MPFVNQFMGKISPSKQYIAGNWPDIKSWFKKRIQVFKEMFCQWYINISVFQFKKLLSQRKVNIKPFCKSLNLITKIIFRFDEIGRSLNCWDVSRIFIDIHSTISCDILYWLYLLVSALRYKNFKFHKQHSYNISVTQGFHKTVIAIFFHGNKMKTHFFLKSAQMNPTFAKLSI